MVRFMTLNINYYMDKHGPWSERRELILEAVRINNPDILALQAVKKVPDSHNGQDQAVQLAEGLGGYPYVLYHHSESYNDGNQDGSAFISRFPMLEHQALPLSTLPGLEDRSQRTVLNGLFQTPLGPLRVFNVHFSWVEDQMDKNLDEAIPYFQSFGEPAILAGDMNSTPDSVLVRRLQQSGWLDAWDFMNPGQNGFTFEAGEPKIRIDYIWIKPVLKQALKKIGLVSELQQASHVHLSDHLGLMAIFESKN
jgi:endonuclease/exonuclease/phosphatase family metal-dependent hydrolase